MRLANLEGRLVVQCADGRWLDAATASDGRYGPEPMDAFTDWEAFSRWAASASPSGKVVTELDLARVGPVVPTPSQVFAVGLNYVDHTIETGFVQPTHPMIFTKYPSCLAGPTGPVALSGESVDWEIELVAVIARTAHRVRAADALSHVAGYTIGQDLSDRETQMRGNPAQFNLGKSYPGFGPIGPYLVTPDELPPVDELTLTCTINDEVVQTGVTGDMVFGLPTLIEYLSGICVLRPGDVIFTGTPPGVGMGRVPARYLRDGDRLVSEITGLGRMEHVATSMVDA